MLDITFGGSVSFETFRNLVDVFSAYARTCICLLSLKTGIGLSVIIYRESRQAVKKLAFFNDYLGLPLSRST